MDNSSHGNQWQTDIAIIGGGVGGCITALALAAKFSVSLIDKYASPPPKVGESLPAAAKRIFQLLRLRHIPGERHLTATGIASWWGSEQVQYVDHLRNPDGAGWHVDRQLLETALRAQLLTGNVRCFWPYSLESSRRDDPGWQLNFKTKTATQAQTLQLQSKLVIDATGRHCTFARQQGATRQQHDKLVSVWMTLQTSKQNPLAQICPDQSGWWYCAPIPHLPGTQDNNNANARILSYQTDADLLPKDFTDKQVLWQAACALPQFADMLCSTDDNTVVHHGKVAANSSFLSRTEDNTWFAIGDAAMSFDPLSSQGMFNAMASGMQLADLLLEKGMDEPASLASIADEYQQQLTRIWHYYQHHKALYYAQERRWVDSEFWRRRLYS